MVAGDWRGGKVNCREWSNLRGEWRFSGVEMQNAELEIRVLRARPKEKNLHWAEESAADSLLLAAGS